MNAANRFATGVRILTIGCPRGRDWDSLGGFYFSICGCLVGYFSFYSIKCNEDGVGLESQLPLSDCFTWALSWYSAKQAAEI